MVQARFSQPYQKQLTITVRDTKCEHCRTEISVQTKFHAHIYCTSDSDEKTTFCKILQKVLSSENPFELSNTNNLIRLVILLDLSSMLL